MMHLRNTACNDRVELALRAFHEKAISVKPTVAAVTILEDRDDCALALASIRTVDGSAFGDPVHHEVRPDVGAAICFSVSPKRSHCS
jgi:hypothetical protein